MEGSRYPDGVLVDNAALKRTETTKAAQIKRLRTDVTSRGVYSGGVITVNSVNTDRIDVSAFSGYTPNGEWIEETSSNTNVALEDSTLGVVNVVFALYTEENIKNMPHESDGSTYPVYSEATYTLMTLNQTDFEDTSVNPTTDDNLSNIAWDRCLILGYVVANGGGALSASDITYASGFDNLKYASPSQLSVLSGVTITAVDPNCPTGTATLRFDDTASAPYYDFYFISPGGTVGLVTQISGDDEFRVTDSSGYWVDLLVVVSQLPLGLTVPYDETFSVLDLYNQDPIRFTGEDVYHRSLVGTGIISETNPHGMSVDDISGENSSFLEEHRDIQHSNGIWRGSNANTLYYTLSSGTSNGDVVQITSPPVGSIYYINGKKLISITNASWVFDSAGFTAGNFGAGEPKEGVKFYEMYVDDSGAIAPYRKATYPNPGRNCDGTWIIDMNQDHPSGSYDLVLVVSGGGTALAISWGGGESVSYPMPSAAGGVAGRVVRLYAPNEYDWIDLYLGDDVGAGDDILPIADNTYTDTVAVYAPLEVEERIRLFSMCYWYDATGPRGKLGFPPTAGTVGGRYLLDHRIWGNLSTYEMTGEAKLDLDEYSNSEYQYSGILLSRQDQYDFKCSWSGGLDVTLNGGIFYCRGKRLKVEGADYTLANNDISVLWLDSDGVVHQDIDAATYFDSDYDQVIEWLVGHPQMGNPDAFLDYQGSGGVTPERGMPLWWITTSGGNVTAIEPMYRGVGRNVIDWSVGTDGGTITTPTMGLGSFGDLKSAFAYAKLECERYKTNKDGINIIVVGDVLISSTVTQPSYVNVVGFVDSGSIITESLTTPNLTGAWVLSSGCRVSDISLEGVTSPCFKLASNCVLDHVSYEDIGGGTFVSLSGTASNVTLQNCKLDVDRGVFLTGGGGTFNYFRFLNNHVTSGSHQNTDGLLDLTNFNYLTLSGNYISRDQTNAGPAVAIRLCTNGLVTGNTVSGTTASTGYGILTEETTQFTIYDNKILGNFDSGIYVGYIGPGLGACYDISINDNLVESDNNGILLYYVIGSEVLSNLVNVAALGESLVSGSHGIYAASLTTRANISRNIVNFGTPASAILELSSGISAISSSTVSILDNVVSLDYNGLVSGTNTYGIRTYALKETYEVSRNTIYNDRQNGVTASTFSHGLYITYNAASGRGDGLIFSNVIYGSHGNNVPVYFEFALVDSTLGTLSNTNRITFMNNLAKLYSNLSATPDASHVGTGVVNWTASANNYVERHATTTSISLIAMYS